MERTYCGQTHFAPNFGELGRVRQTVIGLSFAASVFLIVCCIGNERREGFAPGVLLGIVFLAIGVLVYGPRRILHDLQEFWREYG